MTWHITDRFEVAVVKVHTSPSQPVSLPQALAVLARVAFSSKLVVDNLGGPGLFTTIQDAINAADPNDTVLVRKNSLPTGWQEQVIITVEGLTITGEDPVAASKSYFISDRGDDSKNNDQCGIFCTIWRIITKIFHFLTFGLFEGDPPATATPTGAPTPDDGLDEVFCPDTILDGDDDIIILVEAANVIIEKLTFRFGSVDFGTGSDGSTFRGNCFFPSSDDTIQTTNGERDSLVITNNQIFNEISSSIDLDCAGCMISYNTIRPCDDGIDLIG
jgi:hypothetical protein